LSSQKIVGVATSRGSREYQEDAYGVHTLQLDPKEVRLTLDKLRSSPQSQSSASSSRASNTTSPTSRPASPSSSSSSATSKQSTPVISWEGTPETSGSEFLSRQISFFGIYDGHGGREVSAYLAENLHRLIEEVLPEEIDKLVKWTQGKHGGYFRRWRGGALHRWTQWAHALPPEVGSGMTLEERLTLAFLHVSGHPFFAPSGSSGGPVSAGPLLVKASPRGSHSTRRLWPATLS
jgi:protein phosphatase PTC6